MEDNTGVQKSERFTSQMRVRRKVIREVAFDMVRVRIGRLFELQEDIRRERSRIADAPGKRSATAAAVREERLETCPEDPDADPAGLERAFMRGAIDALRKARHDHDPR